MSELIVSKFGGSSLADGIQFEKVKAIIEGDKKRRYIVPSAPGKRNSKDHKVTDLLYMCYQLASHGLNIDEVFGIIENRYMEICQHLSLEIDITKSLKEIKEDIKNGRSRDYAASRGEYLNGIILASYLGFEFIDPKDLIIFDERGNYNKEKTNHNIKNILLKSENAVIPGFYGAYESGSIKTFSRGGSDITGSIIANGVDAILYENWTDVSGFLMADPKIVKDPMPIEVVTYRELRELSYMGAPVLHEESIFPVKEKGIPINIKNTNRPEDKGTLIVNDDYPIKYSGKITGIAGKKDFTVISIEKTLMSLEKDFFRKVISVFETNDITIEHMPSSIDSISVIIEDEQLGSKLNKIIEELKIYCKPDNVNYEKNMSLLAIVGRGMIRSRGVSGRVFTALAKEDVNIRMITQGASELNIIIGVENKDFEKAVSGIYKSFLD